MEMHNQKRTSFRAKLRRNAGSNCVSVSPARCKNPPASWMLTRQHIGCLPAGGRDANVRSADFAASPASIGKCAIKGECLRALICGKMCLLLECKLRAKLLCNPPPADFAASPASIGKCAIKSGRRPARNCGAIRRQLIFRLRPPQ